MNFQPADFFSVALFCLFAVLMFVFILFSVWRTGYAFKRFVILFSGYLVIFMGVVVSGLPQQMLIPVVPLLFLSVFVMSFAIAFSEYGRQLSRTYPLAALVGFQVFRLPLELILHQWASVGTIPETMTWTGQNLDILTGVAALLSLPFLNKSRNLVWIVQILGCVLLLNVLRVVVMSSPLPFSWPLENPLLLVLHMPYALIGPLFVGAALTAHLITFRALRWLSLNERDSFSGNQNRLSRSRSA